MAEAETESVWAAAIGEAIRLELGLRPQKWLAEQMDIDASTVSRFIKGKQLPTLDQLDSAAKVLGTTRRLLLERAGYVDTEGDIDLASLPPEARAAVLGAYAGVVERLQLHGRDGTADGVDNGL